MRPHLPAPSVLRQRGSADPNLILAGATAVVVGAGLVLALTGYGISSFLSKAPSLTLTEQLAQEREAQKLELELRGLLSKLPADMLKLQCKAAEDNSRLRCKVSQSGMFKLTSHR